MTGSIGATQRMSGAVPANHTEESEVCGLSGKESGIGSGTPLIFVKQMLYNPPPKRGFNPFPDSFPKSSQASLSSVWFTGTTPESVPCLVSSWTDAHDNLNNTNQNEAIYCIIFEHHCVAQRGRQKGIGKKVTINEKRVAKK